MATAPTQEQDDRQQSGVIVGVDGSDASFGALRWAVGRAAALGGWVDAVYVFRCATELGVAVTSGGDDDHEQLAVVSVAEQELRRTVERALGAPIDRTVRRCVVLAGDPADGLCGLAGPDDLIVIGTPSRSRPDGPVASPTGSWPARAARWSLSPGRRDRRLIGRRAWSPTSDAPLRYGAIAGRPAGGSGTFGPAGSALGPRG